MIEYLISLYPRLIEGFGLSLTVYAFTLILSIPLGFVGAYLMTRNSKLMSKVFQIYTWLIRGTPLLLQLYFVFYALPLILPLNIRDNRIIFGILTFTINYTAYFIEIFRGGIQSIPQGQWEAAKLLEMSKKNTVRFIIVPQVIRNSLFAVGNEAITLVKDTSLLAAVALPELLMIAKESLSRDSRIDALIAAAIGYLLFTYIVVTFLNIISTKLRVEGKQ